MKHSILFAVLGLTAFGAAAQEVGNVISSTPVIQQVAVPRTTCAPGVVAAQPATSGGGSILGALTGAAVGNTVGGGAGHVAAMIAGTAIGAIVGNNIEANNVRAQQAATPNCVTETTYENRTVGYDVTYEFGGRQYTTRMPYDPGRTIRLQVTPVSQAPAPSMAGVVTAPPLESLPPPVVQSAPAPVMQSAPPVVQSVPAPVVQAAPPVMVQAAPPVMVQAAPVYVQPYPVYPAYPYPVYPAYRAYPPVSLSLGFVFGGHRHWGGGYRGGHRWR